MADKSQTAAEVRRKQGPGFWMGDIGEEEVSVPEVSQQRHTSYPGIKQGKNGPDKRVKKSPLDYIESLINKLSK